MYIEKVPIQMKPFSFLVFGVADSYIDMNDYIMKMGFPYPENRVVEESIQLEGYAYGDPEGKNYYVLIHKLTSPGYIAHEIRHALNHIYIDIHQENDLRNDEVDCGMLGYFVDHLISVQQRCIKKQNKNR